MLNIQILDRTPKISYPIKKEKIMENLDQKKLLKEIDFEKHKKNLEKFKTQNEIHEKIRNDEDYDDWEYGTEPIFG